MKAESKSDAPSTFRLVIRAEILPEAAPRRPPQRQLNKRVLALAVVSIVVLILSWVGFRMLRTDPPVKPAVSEEPIATTAEARPAEAAVEPNSTEAISVEPPVRDEPDASPAPVDAAIPTVPKSALRTIRGTIRVSVRLAVDAEGKVIAATTEERGPSRYFERLAIEASKKWTFAPVDAQAQRRVLVRFTFTRDGVTARTSAK